MRIRWIEATDKFKEYRKEKAVMENKVAGSESNE